MSVIPFIQARMDSERLPGKSMMPIAGKPMLAHVVDACCNAGLSPVVIVPAASVNAPIRAWCDEHSVSYSSWPVRGVRDPLAEFTYAARKLGDYTWILRLTADCPMLEPHHIELFVSLLGNKDCIYTNRPADADGYDMEGFTVRDLRIAFGRATGQEREHICPSMYAMPGSMTVRFSVMGNPHDAVTPGKVSVDTIEEYELVKHLMEDHA